jgi:hypothetical protein
VPQEITQAPFEQTWFAAQAVPHPPLLDGFDARLTQAPPHSE